MRIRVREATLVAIGMFALFAAPFRTHAGGGEKERYSTPYGSNPYLPSQATAAFEGFLSPNQFPTAEYCGKCHKDSYKEWRESAHGNAFREPFYQKNVNYLIEQRGIEVTRHCEGCHNPVALFSGALTPGSKVDRSHDDEGVTCMTCHAMKGVQNTSGTGSYIMGVPAVMLNEDGTPRAGLPTDSEIQARPDLHKRAVMKDVYRSPEFCATCHKAAMPRQLNQYKWLRAFSVWDEWQQSSWSKQSPLPYYKKDHVVRCQNCHMPEVPAATDPGAKNGKLRSHRWLGANTAIPLIYNYPEQLKKTEEFLKEERLALDFFAITDEDNHRTTAPLGSSGFILSPGQRITLDLVIQNKGIGHSLVPEQRDFYEAWVQFEARDDKGQVVFRSGYLDPDGTLEPGAHSYTNRLVSANGQYLDKHEIWKLKVRSYDNTILPGRSDLVRYRFTLPRTVQNSVTVTAKVQYRRFRRDFSDYVMGAPREFPIVQMASKTLMLKMGRNAPSGQANDQMRWNNYAIALAEQQQFAAAVDAFKHVVKINPKYADGYINVASAEYGAGNYDETLRWAQKALEFEPGNLRALFYEAIALRWQLKYEPAIERFQKIAAVYPRLRQVHQELGYVYLLQRRFQLARAEYEAVQQIDPDDLLAHRYLSAIYSELGMKAQAEQQAALIADRKEDPVAGWVAQDYWRRDPNVARELVPFHVHSDDPADNQAKVHELLNVMNPPSHIWFQN